MQQNICNKNNQLFVLSTSALACKLQNNVQIHMLSDCKYCENRSNKELGSNPASVNILQKIKIVFVQPW